MKYLRLVRWLWWWSCLQVLPVFPCQYNVRDLGFIDMDIGFYAFYGYVRQDTPPEITSNFTEVASTTFRDSNVRLEIVNTDRQKDHPAMKYAATWELTSYPAGIFVSPDGQSLPVMVSRAGKPFTRSLSLALEELVASPKRDEILRQVNQAFGVALLVEGENPRDNLQAKQAVAGAIDQIREQMQSLPKPIARPPVQLVIEREALERERVLLWSLGLNLDKPGPTYAAVIYGRARWVGPLMKGPEISEANLTRIFSILGADCECGLDLSWTQGTRLPVRWGEELQAQAAKNLGFDPENPTVKMEAGRILRRSLALAAVPTARTLPAGQAGNQRYSRAPFGYQELAVDAEPDGSPQSVILESNSDKESPRPPVGGPLSSSPLLAKSEPALTEWLWVIAGLGLLSVAAGLWILYRAKGGRA